MHMADALLSPAVGGAMWAVSAATVAGCSARVRSGLDERKVPLMAVLGAFVFAAQMINFSIPGTGSSGHLGGGLLLAILLGPSAAFLTIASVLVVQALFFADGGLLALGCNIFNMAFLPAFVVFPLCYRTLIGPDPSRRRFSVVTIVSSLLASQLGPFAVVLETLCSGVSALPFSTFLLLMQPVHLALGLVEGVVTVAVISFVGEARPDIVNRAAAPLASRRGVGAFLAAALIVAGVLSSLATKEPDGLESALGKGRGTGQLAREGAVHRATAALQQATAWFPGYQLRHRPGQVATPALQRAGEGPGAPFENGIAGIAGTVLTLLVVFLTAFLLKKLHQRRRMTEFVTGGGAPREAKVEVLPGGTGGY